MCFSDVEIKLVPGNVSHCQNSDGLGAIPLLEPEWTVNSFRRGTEVDLLGLTVNEPGTAWCSLGI